MKQRKPMNKTTQLFLVLFIFSLCFLNGCSLFFKVPEPEEREIVFGDASGIKLPASFDVLVWNIYKGRKGDKFLSEFKTYSDGKDLIILQEVMVGERLVESAYQYKANFQFFFVTSFYKQEEASLVKTGVATGANRVAVELNSLKSPSNEGGFTTPKVTAYSYYELEGIEQQLLVVNIHALNFVFLGEYKAHIMQAGEKIKTHKGPVIFAGDFNTNFPQGAAKEKFLFEYIKELGLENVVFSQDGRRQEHTECEIKSIIDFIFIRGLAASNAFVPSSGGADHCPLIATLKLDS